MNYPSRSMDCERILTGSSLTLAFEALHIVSPCSLLLFLLLLSSPEHTILITDNPTRIQIDDKGRKASGPQTQKGTNTPSNAAVARSDRFREFGRRLA